MAEDEISVLSMPYHIQSVQKIQPDAKIGRRHNNHLYDCSHIWVQLLFGIFSENKTYWCSAATQDEENSYINGQERLRSVRAFALPVKSRRLDKILNETLVQARIVDG